jgi:hypothetical protein
MFSSAKADIVTDGSGNATVYLSHGENRKLNGFLVALKYTPGTIDTGATLTITGETSGIPIITKTSAGTSNVFYYPRALANEVASPGATVAGTTERIPIKDERIKVVVSLGTATKAGSIEAILQVNSPY